MHIRDRAIIIVIKYLFITFTEQVSCLSFGHWATVHWATFLDLFL